MNEVNGTIYKAQLHKQETRTVQLAKQVRELKAENEGLREQVESILQGDCPNRKEVEQSMTFACPCSGGCDECGGLGVVSRTETIAWCRHESN